MQPPAGGPVMAITVDAVANLQVDDLGGLWNVFTKCKESLEDGRRLENISWRLWYQELSHHHHSTVSPVVITTSHDAQEITSAVESDGDATSEEGAADDWDKTTAVADVDQSVPQQIRPSSRGISPSPRRLHNSHPQSSTIRPFIDSHRANSAPSQYRSSSKYCVNVGKIISSLLPHKIPVPTIQRHASSSDQPPAVVVLGPTPCPTPPRTPRTELHRSTSPHLSVPVTSPSVPPPPPPEVNEASSSGSAQSLVLSARPAEETHNQSTTTAGRKKATFFFKESPGTGENLTDVAASVSTTSSGMKTPVPPTLPINGQPAQPQINSKTPSRNPKKGKEVLKPALPARQLPARQTTARHHVPPRNTLLNHHHRNHSTIPGNTSRHIPVRSKSSTAIALPVAQPAAAHDSTAKPSESQPPLKQVAEQAAPATTNVGPVAEASKAFTKTGRLEIATSSDFETTDTDGEDSSWASDYSDEEEETGGIARQAAIEAARQREMFAKVPTPSYVNLAQNRKSGLLTNLFHPDPTVVLHLPHQHPFRAHNSAQNLGARPSTSMSSTPLQTSKSSAAVPLAAQVNVTQAAFHPSGRPGYRLRGRPEGADVESSEDEDDGVPLSKSLAQRRLEALAGISKKNTKTSSSNPPPSAVVPDDVNPLPPVPMPLPHPYNLPVPPPPATPRTTRREMLKTEMSESLRRQILWERETNRRMMRGGVRRGGILSGLRPLTTTADSGASQDDPQKRTAPAGLVRNWSSDDYHTAGW
ncbi:hypothetical protein FRC03_008979 [Tulasnella sp. 419]|nr:hypothetical protein FRC03_008979 [Tulasnella sp. 419]